MGFLVNKWKRTSTTVSAAIHNKHGVQLHVPKPTFSHHGNNAASGE